MNFLSKIEKFDSNICLVDEKGRNFSYENILGDSERISKNLETGNLILVLASNHVEFITCYICFLRKKLTQMLISPQIGKNLLNNLITEYLPTYIFLPNSKNIYLKNYETIFELKNHKILKCNKGHTYSINKNLALLLSTSGSTGSKKFIRISHKNISDNTQNIIKYLNIKKNHKTITTMPPFYTYGLSIINTHLFVGASIIVSNVRAIEKLFWKLIKEQKVTSFGGVPYFYEILRKLKFHKINLPNLKYFTQAGGPTNQEMTKYLLNYAEKNQIKFIVMYGQAEATARMTYLPSKVLRNKIGSVGIPIPGGKIILRNEKGKKDSKGEIIYMGKNVSLGYAKNFKDLTKGDENQGILKTGDLGKKDKDGYLYIVGRKSRNVKLFGHRVNLDDLEKILFNRGYNCVCCGFDNKVTIFHKDAAYGNEVVKYLSQIINIHSDCFKLKHIKKFPLNEIGKVSYKKLESFL